jgi:hypothetical protein
MRTLPDLAKMFGFRLCHSNGNDERHGNEARRSPIKLSLAQKASIGVEKVQYTASGEVTVPYDAGKSPPQLNDVIISTGFGVDGIDATTGHDPARDHSG